MHLIEILYDLDKFIGRDLVSTIAIRLLDSYQSEDKKTVILDMVRDGNGFARDPSFIKGEQQATVALTRPRDLLLVVTNKR